MTAQWPPPLAGERETILPRPGGQVRYRITEPNEARGTIVLLHGLASNLTRWSEFVEHTSLRARWRIIRIDLRGHGLSETTGAARMELWSDDIAAILDAEHIKQVVVVGHSLGAHLAIHLASRHPARVAAVAVIDPLLREAVHGRMRWLFVLAPINRVLSELFRFANALGIRKRRIPPLDLRALDEMTRTALARLGEPSAIVRKYISPRADLRHIRTSQYFRDFVELVRPLPLDSIRQPALAVLSRGLTFSDLAATRQRFAGLAQIEIAEIDAYHWPLTEKPVEVRHAIEEWCRHQAASLRPAAPKESR